VAPPARHNRSGPCRTRPTRSGPTTAGEFADLPKKRSGPTATWRRHPVDRVCRQNGIGHRLTKPNRPWANGQVERMNRTIKEATVRRHHYDTHDQLRRHLDAFVAAYDFAKRLKTLTPHEFICKTWLEDPGQFHSDPNQHNLGLYT
jgi:transposase InsO family protein